MPNREEIMTYYLELLFSMNKQSNTKAWSKQSKAKLSQAKQSQAEQSKAKQSKAKQSQAKPSKAKQSQAKPNNAKNLTCIICSVFIFF